MKAEVSPQSARKAKNLLKFIFPPSFYVGSVQILC